MFSDVVCPWCYIGVTRLERAAATYTLQTGDPVQIALRAFQLDPEAPSDGAAELEVLADRFGGRERADQVADQVSTVARGDGIEIDLARAVRANTRDAHRMLIWAEITEGLGAQRDLAHELWRAHFLEGADVADHDTLAARAGVVGLDVDAADAWLASDGGADEVRMQVDAAASAGISAVPTLVVAGQYVVRGAQPQDTYLQVLHELAARAG